MLQQAGDHAADATAVVAQCINVCTHAARNVALLDLPSSPPDGNLSHVEMLTVHPFPKTQKHSMFQDIAVYRPPWYL